MYLTILLAFLIVILIIPKIYSNYVESFDNPTYNIPIYMKKTKMTNTMMNLTN